MSQPRTLAICVATYRRSKMLMRLLAGIADLVLPEDTRVELRIIENDAAATCEALITNWRNRNPHIPTHYAVQPERNIATTRNLALEMGKADLYAFIDDDETPEPTWLLELLATMEDGGFDAVFGDVVGELPASAPRWIRRGKFLSKHVHRQLGVHRWQATRTANAIVRGDWLHDRRFDPKFGASGGEDTQLFRRMATLGARFGWAPDARVHESVQAEQCSLAWLFRRYRRSALVYEQIAPRRWPTLRALRRIAIAGATVCAGLPAMLVGSNTLIFTGCLRFASALGGLDYVAGASHRSLGNYESAGCES
ncbi:MAG: succinoglycan biosynthesis protein ExoM [Hyphomicrobiaceae bacterium]|jgi:succinoglycan biosynthesis protein ExoM